MYAHRAQLLYRKVCTTLCSILQRTCKYCNEFVIRLLTY